MRRWIIGMVIVGIVLAAGVSYGQQSGPAMPEKVRAFLDRMTGTWEVRAGEETGRIDYRWNAGRSAVIGDASYDKGEISGFGTELFYWDGASEDGIAVSMSYAGDEGLYHAQIHGRVLSESRMTGHRTAVAAGKNAACDVQLTFEGLDRFVWRDTNAVLGEEAQPDIAAVHTRIKASSDEQELLGLQEVWCRAEVEKDAAALRRILADDFVIVTSEGDIITRDQMMRSGEHILTSLTARDLKVQLYADTALLRGIAQWTEPGGKSTEIVFTDTWLKRDGRWQCIISHESGAKETMAAELTKAHEVLTRLAGNWTWKGTQVNIDAKDSPFGQGGAFTGKETSRLVMGGLFLQGHWEEDNPKGHIGGISMTAYDPEKGCYVVHDYLNDGSVASGTFTIEGNVRKSLWTYGTEADETVLARITETFSPDWSSSKATWEVSTDNGTAWKYWATIANEKAK